MVHKYSGQETDGKFGLNLFENKVVSIDFDKNILTVSAELPTKIKQYDKYSVSMKDGLMFIKAVCQIDTNRFENEFMIHSGYAGDILLDDKFAAENKMGKLIKIIDEKKLKDSYGNTIVTAKGILPLFTIDKIQLKNIPIGFFEGTIGQQSISIMGGDIIKRFNWIIDAERKFIYLKPNDLFKINYSQF